MFQVPLLHDLLAQASAVPMTASQWLLACVAAILIGLSKTGIAGIGILSVVMFAFAFPARESVGIVLPILICGDIVAAGSYYRHAIWSHLVKLVPWAAIGLVIGYKALGHVNDHQVAHIIGVTAIVLTLIQIWRRVQILRDPDRADDVPHQAWFAATMGILAGFTTMVANGAGPIMVLYLLATGLPKMEFMGTGALFFFMVNCAKVPFMASLGMISTHSLPMSLLFMPLAIAGSLGGRVVLKRIKQSVFEDIALVLTIVAGVRLLIV